MGCLCFRWRRAHDHRPSERPFTSQPISSSTEREKHRKPALALHISPSDDGIPASNDAQPHTPDSPSVSSPKLGLTLLTPRGANIERSEECSVDVIAIHGLNGDPRDTWTYKMPGREIFWLQDFLPKAVPGARIYTYGYDAKLCFSNSTGDISTYAKGLLDYIDMERESLAQKSRPIIFICHSMGGLVCKKALVIANEKKCYHSILNSTKAIFFFGTPHQGSHLADTILRASFLLSLPTTSAVQVIVGKGKPLRSELVEELSPESKSLDELCSAFVERADNIPCIISFCEVNKIRGQLIVSQRTATIGVVNENVIPLDGKDHRQICRIKNEHETAYQRIVRECRSIGTGSVGRSRVLSDDEQKCLDSLEVHEEDEEPPRTRPSPAEGTCEWILAIQQFNTWRKGLLPLLWISGEYGSGKTTMISFLKHRLMVSNDAIDIKETKKRLTICSYFCVSGNGGLTSGAALLQGLLLDIVSQRHDLIHHLLSNLGHSPPWLYKDLWRVFQAILDDPRSSGVYVMIDAIDECDVQSRTAFLRDLTVYLEQRSYSSSIHVNFVVSSRLFKYKILAKHPALTSAMMLDEDAVLQKYILNDIRRFVLDGLIDLVDDGRLFSDDVSETSLKLESLADTVATRSGGSFLWASLVLQEVQKRSYIRHGDLETFIAECPPDLNGVYYKSLMEVHYLSREAAVKSLRILLAAKRPLKLAEFKTAFVLKERDHALRTLEEAVEKEQGTIPWLQDCLGIMVRIDGSTIALRHESVRAFLLGGLAVPRDTEQQRSLKHNTDVQKAFSMSMQDAESTLAACCIYYLQAWDFNQKKRAREHDVELWDDSGLGAISISPTEKATNSPSSTPESPGQNSLEAFHTKTGPSAPFLDYAASNWGCHYASADAAGESLTDAALELSTAPNLLRNWSERYRRLYWGYNDLPESLNALIVTAYFGQTFMARKLISNDEYQSSWSLALTWAARMGHASIVKLLIEYGTPCVGALLDGRTAFSWAAVGGFVEIVDTLLQYDQDLINEQDANGRCPLVLAAQYQHPEIVDRLLTSSEILVNLESREGTTAFHCTIGGSNPSVREMEIFYKLLHDDRTDITPRDRHGRSCLSYLAENGATEAIQALVKCEERQAAVLQLLDDEGDNNGVSPLSHATIRGHAPTVRLLYGTHKIDRQLESVDNLDGANVFDLAAKNGRVDIIKYLGKVYPQGLNSRDATGRTPLSTAMWGTNDDVLRALLDCGADVDLPDFNGRTPVSHGVWNVGFVRVLVGEYGADINKDDDAGHTPLWYARDKDERFQQQLKELGARM